MLRFLSRRIIAAIVLVIVISVITFWLTRAVPGDQARAILGVAATDEQVLAKRAELGLDQNVFIAYFEWLRGAVVGNLGTSWFTAQDVSQSIASRLPVTLSVTIGAVLLSGITGLTLGIVAAVRRGWLDRIAQGISVLGFAIPNFILALVLVTVVAVQWRWLPATGYTPPTTSVVDWLRSIILPMIALAVAASAAVFQQTRNAAIAVLRQDYMRTLRSRGLPHGRLYAKHLLRNAAPAALTILSLQFIGLLSGAVIVEYIFALPGLGTLALGAASQKDQPVVQGVVLVMVVCVVVVNLVVDLAYGWLNPKVRAR